MGIKQRIEDYIWRPENPHDDEDNLVVTNDPIPVHLENEKLDEQEIQPESPEGEK